MKKFFYRIFMFVFILSSFTVTGSIAQLLSTDQLLEYSLESLREKMDGAVKQNKNLSSKNSSIRNRILLLKKEAREFDDAIMRLREQAVSIENQIKLEAKELKIEEKRLNNVLEQKRHLELERDTLTKQIETTVLERNLLEQDVNETSFDVRTLKEAPKNQISGNLLNYYSDEKMRFLELLKGSRTRLNEKRDKVDSLEIQFVDKLREKEFLTRQQETLKRTLGDFELRLNEEESRRDLLKKGEENWRDDLKSKRKECEDRNEELRQYLKMLKIVVNDLKAVRDELNSEHVRDEAHMNRILSQLKEEKTMLVGLHEITEEDRFSHQRRQDADHAVLLLEQQLDEIKRQKEEVIKEFRSGQDHLAGRKKENMLLQENIGHLEKSLVSLHEDLKNFKKSVNVIRENTFGEKRAEVRKELENARVSVGKFEEDINRLQKDIENKQQLLTDSQQKRESWESDIKKAEEYLERLKAENQELLKSQRELEQFFSDRKFEMEKEINEAKMRKKALEASIDVVHKKYKAGKDELESFEAEQAELQGYLNVLKKENSTLQGKISVLEVKK
ncbi:MAG: hypothetical protein AB1650_06935 [Candidatus Omnitrophota bacterium]